ncbi:hypothetical protein [Nonomuraea africana]|uniref:ABC-type uncharacterized transport system permease subunit n=1 Tax=Nonomuraea africana TaxID=46171 RepID=A0ABR9KBY3_9ACTN|nr:hypothetical protein [Nonomuraea africana]MBE1559516.1 ABC-type uncharacterized transport system permease subunit [Nonomuraea africana]
METHESRPSAAEAAAALAAAQQARAAGYAPIPAWFFPVVGVLIGVTLGLQALHDLAILPVLAVVVAGYVLTERVYHKRVARSGIQPRQLTLRQQLVLVTPMAALWVAGEILDSRGDWIWLVVAVLAACWTIGYGLVHNRRARASA